MKKTIICLDRDGTLIYDDKYHLGRSNDWKKKIKILPGVTSGIKELQKIPQIRLYMITNQPGVAVKEFKLLTEQRAYQVSQYIFDLFKKKKAFLDGYFVCTHASPAYTKRRAERTFHKKLVCNCSCIKPRLGMVFSSLKAEGVKRSDVKLYVIGDRASDLQTAINAKGIGIYIPFKGEAQEQEKIEALKRKYKSRIYLAKNFKDAAGFIIKREKKHKR